MTIDALKEKWDGIYAWNVKEGKVEPPKHTFPKAVKDRADYFAEVLDRINANFLEGEER